MITTLITADNRIADMLYSLYDARMSFVHLNLIVYSTLVLDGSHLYGGMIGKHENYIYPLI